MTVGTEGVIRRIDWARVLLCGFVAGVVWHLLSAALLAWFGGDLLDAVQSGRRYAPRGGLYFFSVDLAMGVWAVWLYAAIRPRTSRAPKAAAVAGLAWWLLKSLESAKWLALGFIAPNVVLAPLVATLPAVVLAALVGAWLYGE
jgi:hypothetical protein